MRIAWVVLLCLAACVDSNAVTCGPDLVCPTGYVCDVAQARCIDPAGVAACATLAESDPCAVHGLPGICMAGSCAPTFCGDGVRAPGEDCDGTDLGDATCASLHYYIETTGLACKADCTFDRRGCEGACGDGIINGGELCDGADLGTPAADCTKAGYYNAPGLACSPFCTYDVKQCSGTCGDDMVNGGELCDGALPVESCFDVGFDVGTMGCSNACGFSFDGCGRIGWQFQTSLPSSGTPYSVHASSRSDVWTVAMAGVARHFDGTTWAPFTLGSADLSSVWTAGPTAAWASDSAGALWRFNGTSWAIDATAPLNIRAVWGTSATDIWVVTSGSGVHRWNGTVWTAVGTPPLSDAGLTIINGSSANDVWVSNASIVRHWNGTSWSAPASVAASMTVESIYTIAPNDAWAVGHDPSYGVRAHWNGTVWTPTSVFNNDYISVTGSASNDVWVCGSTSAAHYDGHGWTPVDRATPARLFELDPGTMYAASRNQIDLYTGLLYGLNDPLNANPSTVLFSTAGDAQIVIGQQGLVYRFDGATWTTDTLDLNDISGVLAAWGTSKTNLWVATGYAQTHHFTGSTWTTVPVTPSGIISSSNMWGSGSSDIWYGGLDGAIRHFDGVSWTGRDIAGFTVGKKVIKIWGSGPNDVWALSNNSRLFRWTTSWTEVTNVPAGSVDLVVVGPNQAIVISGQAAYHGNASLWTRYDLPNVPLAPDHLVALGPNFVFGLSKDGDLFHFDGTRWTLVTAPNVAGAAALALTPNRLDILYDATGGAVVHSLVITRPWRCLATEVGNCNDAVDNDCDGALDQRDIDCP